MSEITLDTIERGMKATCGTVLRNEIYFCELDALAGDGRQGAVLSDRRLRLSAGPLRPSRHPAYPCACPAAAWD